jgi:cell division protein FtsZ
MIVVTGVESPQIYGRSKSAQPQTQTETQTETAEDSSDIDYVE